MLCGDLDGKELQKRGGLCVHVAGSLHSAAESSTALRNSCSPIKVSLKKKDSISILQCFYFNWRTPANFVFFFFFFLWGVRDLQHCVVFRPAVDWVSYVHEYESFSRSVVSDSLQPHGPGSSVHGILQARILEWVTIPFSRESP